MAYPPVFISELSKQNVLNSLLSTYLELSKEANLSIPRRNAPSMKGSEINAVNHGGSIFYAKRDLLWPVLLSSFKMVCHDFFLHNVPQTMSLSILF